MSAGFAESPKTPLSSRAERSVNLEVEFVCIPRPLERNDRPDGGPLAYRITPSVKPWKPGTAPKLERKNVEGKLPLLV